MGEGQKCPYVKEVLKLLDIDIKKLFFARSESAITELTSKYGALMNKVAFNILGDFSDCEECINDTCLALWNTIPPRDPESLSGYALKVLKNISHKRYHQKTAQKRDTNCTVALSELEETLSECESAFECSELAEHLNAFLKAQPKDVRVLFVRRYYLGMTVAELAKERSMTPHAVSVKLHRTREKLKKYLILKGEYL